jgi:hypothetical protein
VSRIWQRGTIRQEVFLKAFGRGVCGRECIVIQKKNCSMGESGKHSGMRDVRTMCGSRTGGWSLPCVMSD